MISLYVHFIPTLFPCIGTLREVEKRGSCQVLGIVGCGTSCIAQGHWGGGCCGVANSHCSNVCYCNGVSA